MKNDLTSAAATAEKNHLLLQSLEGAIELTALAVWQLDVSTGLVSCNTSCRKLLLLPGETDLSLQQFLHVLPENDRHQLEANLARLAAGSQEKLRACMNHFLFSCKVITAADGQVQFIAGVVSKDQEPAPNETLVQKVMRGKSVGMFWINLADDSIEYTPALSAILTGTAETNLSRKDLVRHIHPEDKQAREEAYQRAAITGDLYYEGRTIWQDGSIHWVRTIGSYTFDETGKPAHLSGTLQDITEQKQQERSLYETEDRFRSMIDQAPMGIALLMGRELIVEVGNQKIFELWGKDPRVKGRPILEILPEIENQGFLELLQDVYNKGVPYYGNSFPARLVRNGNLEEGFFDFTYTPLRDRHGTVSGIMVLANEVTLQVQARKKLEESEQRFVNLIQEAPFATALYKGRDMVIEIANEAMIKLWGRDTSVIGEKLGEALPELEGQPFLQLLEHVFTTGQAHHEQEARAELLVNGKLSTFYFNYTYKPMRNEYGEIYAILNMAVDVTEQVLARRRLEDSELFAHSIIYNSPVAKMVVSGPEYTISIVNENVLEILGRDNDIVGQPLKEAVPLFWEALCSRLKRVTETGKTIAGFEEEYQVVKNGRLETGYFNSIFKSLPSVSGGYHGVIVTMVDITEQVRNRQRIAEAKEALRGAIELAELGTWEMDVPEDVFYYSERLCQWTGFNPGVPISREAGISVIHPEDRGVVVQAVEQSLQPGSKTPFNAEYRLIHPVTGEERIVHAQGITVFNLEGTPLKLTGTVRDVTKDRQLQAALELEVKKRTSELNLLNKQLTDAVSELAAANEQLRRSNEDLAQYAHVASHDLQEPLRKIRMFSGMLKEKGGAPAENSGLINKINQSAERMSLLIKDLLDYSRLLKTEDTKKIVDLNVVLSEVLVDFELTIREKGANVQVDTLPVIEAVPLQMNQLFFNLVGNALKFLVADRKPEIRINATLVDGQAIANYLPAATAGRPYYHIRVSDNGIGFEAKYAQQIFEVFKRLHGKDVYPGSGIGLALCRRIVDNHQGHIFATSEPDAGTTFHVILPVSQAAGQLM